MTVWQRKGTKECTNKWTIKRSNTVGKNTVTWKKRPTTWLVTELGVGTRWRRPRGKNFAPCPGVASGSTSLPRGPKNWLYFFLKICTQKVLNQGPCLHSFGLVLYPLRYKLTLEFWHCLLFCYTKSISPKRKVQTYLTVTLTVPREAYCTSVSFHWPHMRTFLSKPKDLIP